MARWSIRLSSPTRNSCSGEPKPSEQTSLEVSHGRTRRRACQAGPGPLQAGTLRRRDGAHAQPRRSRSQAPPKAVRVVARGHREVRPARRDDDLVPPCLPRRRQGDQPGRGQAGGDGLPGPHARDQLAAELPRPAGGASEVRRDHANLYIRPQRQGWRRDIARHHAEAGADPSHGRRANLLQTGELKIHVAFLGVTCCDEFGNGNGSHGELNCGALGYAKVDAQYARTVVLLTPEIVPFPNHPASISQDEVDLIVHLDEVGDPKLISKGAARTTRNPRELLIASHAADVVEHSHYLRDGFSVQTGSGASSIAATQFIGEKMTAKGITASFALGGITGGIADLHAKGLIKTLIDVQSFDIDAAKSLRQSPAHIEISANEYANATSKGAYVDRVDVVILAALEIDLAFNVNVITGSDGVLRGASGGHCDVAAAANLVIVVAPLVRGRMPTVVNKVTTVITPGESIGVLVTDQGIAVNPKRPELAKRLLDAGLPVVGIEELHRRAIALTGEPEPLRFLDRIVGVIRYRDGTVIDVVRQVDERV